MKLKTIYATEEEIPEGYGDLYTERNGQWELTGVEGVKTQGDIDRVQSALTKERADHKVAKESLKAFEGINPEEVHTMQTELESAKAQLEAIGDGGQVDEKKLEPIIAARVRQAVAPLERDKNNLQRKLDDTNKVVAERDGEVNSLKSSITTGNIERTVRDAATELKVLTPALEDVVIRAGRVFEHTEDGRIITKDVNGVTPGLTPKEWLKDMQDKSPHWWPASVGGGSNGGGGPKGTYAGKNNPWSKEGWNITKQGAVVREKGEVKAAEIAAQAGSRIGATKPPAA
jgi:hypothetical protein